MKIKKREFISWHFLYDNDSLLSNSSRDFPRLKLLQIGRIPTQVVILWSREDHLVLGLGPAPAAAWWISVINPSVLKCAGRNTSNNISLTSRFTLSGFSTHTLWLLN